MLGKSAVENPYKKPASRAAWEEGRQARGAGQPREEPRDSYHAHYNAAWAAGWDAQEELERQTQYQKPVIERQKPVIERRGWPTDQPLPGGYRRREWVPCPHCRQQFLPSGSRAVIVRSLLASIVYLRCRACGHLFSLPILDPK